MIRRPPRSTQSRSSAASDVYKRQAHVFEIFAVFYCEAETSPVPYHMAEYSDERFNALIGDVKARSEYTYDVEVTPEDRILSLSTCSYKYGTYTQNPDQRFVVMGRLVREGESYHETANLVKLSLIHI